MEERVGDSARGRQLIGRSHWCVVKWSEGFKDIGSQQGWSKSVGNSAID
jgi:hypothetical protein